MTHCSGGNPSQECVTCSTLPYPTLPCRVLPYLTLPYSTWGHSLSCKQKGKTKRFATNLWSYVQVRESERVYRVQKKIKKKRKGLPYFSLPLIWDLIAFFSARAHCEFQLCSGSAGCARRDTRAVIGSIGWLDHRSIDRSDRFANCAATVSNASLHIAEKELRRHPAPHCHVNVAKCEFDCLLP